MGHICVMENLALINRADLEQLIEEKIGQIKINLSPEDRFVSKKEAAKIAGCAVTTIDNLRRKGILIAHHLSDGKTRGKPVFQLSKLIECIKSL